MKPKPTETRLLSQHLPAAIGSQQASPSTAAPPRESVSEPVEQLFKRFVVHYGTARMAAHWAGQKPEDVNRYWSDRLTGMPRRAVEYGLDHLPDYPPTVDEFRAVCNRCPKPFVRALEHKLGAEEKARGAQRAQALLRRFSFGKRADAQP